MSTWKEALADRMPEGWMREIDIYEDQIELKKQGKVEDKLFQEARLRRGVYGQRYDNGQRHDGVSQRELAYPCGDLRKGPETLWDAPGMQRIKIPFGALSPEQMEVLADLSEEYSDAICHVTTRQDIQLHYVHIDDTPDLMRRLAAVGITTREACGNSVRNVTACPKSGCCRTEAFDVTPYAKATAFHLLGHRDTQDFGRKFKIAFSGCGGEGCAFTSLHDLGFIAKVEDGRRGFEVYVGGGLGPVPYQAKLLEPFVPEAEILPLCQAVSRVFARHGEKKNRGRARIKFLVANWGIEKFREAVREERDQIPAEERWTQYLHEVSAWNETPAKTPQPLTTDHAAEGFNAWAATNVYRQKQTGYAIATVRLPLGDITAWQMRRLADLSRRYNGGYVRTTVEQNMVLRWVAESDLPALFGDLAAIGLAQAGANTIHDVVACPGTDTCKLGIANSRGLAAELTERLEAKADKLDPAIRALQIKISGCFNSCGQHHIGDLGFYGVSRKIDGTTVPHYRVILGARRADNAAQYGQTMGAVPSKRVPEFIERLTDRYLAERRGEESFTDFIERLGKKGIKPLLDEFAEVPPKAENRDLYSDWRDPREFTISDIGTGECAGSVVTAAEFDLQEAERRHFDAQVKLEEGDVRRADETAYSAMLEAAKALVKTEYQDVPDRAEAIVEAFRARFVETGRFQDKYAGGKFAEYLFTRHEDKHRHFELEAATRLIEEAQLFIEAAYACHGRLQEAEQAAKKAASRPRRRSDRLQSA